MTLEEKDQYIEENLMALEPDTLRYMVVDFMAALQETTTLRDQFAMSALTGICSVDDERIYKDDKLSIDEWRSKLRTDDARYCYMMADAMLEARTK